MLALHALFSLVAVCILCAALCFVVYGALRLFGRRFPVALYCFGALSFALWVLMFAGIALLAGVSWDETPTPYPWKLVICISGVLAGTFAAGWLLLQKATQNPLRWWQGVLFCSLYLMAAYALCGSALTLTPAGEGASHSWNYLVSSARFPTHSDGYAAISAFLMWIFPWGAPIAEIGARNFRRVFTTHQEGYPA